jgi:pimeloyl-[acyl-carrier protein] methyl ester esterase
MPWYENRRGERLWYEDAGTGIPIVLIHGWCMSSAVWKYQFDSLVGWTPDSYRLIAPDLRGHGRSREITSRMTFDCFADDLADLFGSLRLSNALLLGWSMGGQIALQASVKMQEKLAGMILISSTPKFAASYDFLFGLTLSETNGMRLKMQRNIQRAREGFCARLFAEDELENNPLSAEIRELLAEIPLPKTTSALEAIDELVNSDMRVLLPEITIPTMIVNGTDDKICIPQASSYMKEMIHGAEQLIFERCGHVPFITNKDKFNSEIVRFARSVCGQND